MADPSSTLLELVARILAEYIQVNAKLFRWLSALTGVSLSVEVPGDIDVRLSKLDIARAALSDSLTAIDQLKDEAERRRIEHAQVLSDLEAAISSKQDADQKLENVQRIMSADIEAFRTMAGVPDVRRERLIGFGSGVLASLVAATVWALADYLF